ncbi:MAG: tetratricopeptide repeat protein, partial [Rhodothermales bacterium]
SVDELHNDVADMLRGHPPQSYRKSLLHRGIHFAIRNRNLVAASILATCILILAILVGLQERGRAERMDAVSASLSGYLSQVIAISDPETRVDSSITARQFLDVGLEQARTLLDPNSEPYLRVATQLGRLYLKIGEAKLAEGVFRELLDHHGDGSNKAGSLLGYAMALHELGIHDAAQKYYVSAYRLASGGKGRDNSLVPEILNGLILLSIDVNQLAHADSLVDASLSLREQDPGSSDAEVAELLVLKAQIMTRYDSLDHAERLYQRALEMQQKSLGPNSIQSAVTMNNLGLIYIKTGRHRIADQVLTRALQIKKSRLGSSHPSVATTLMNIAEAKKYTVGRDSAIITEKLALRLLLKKLGEKSERVAQARNNLAILLEGTGEYGEAESLYRAAIAGWEVSLPTNHPTLLKGMHNLGMLIRERGRPEESLQYYSRVVSGYRYQGLNFSRELSGALIGQAKAQRSVGDLVGAAASFRESLAIREKELPAGHWRIGTAKSLLGETLGLLGEHEQAEKLLESGLKILQTARGPDDPKTLEAQERLEKLQPSIFVHADLDQSAH